MTRKERLYGLMSDLEKVELGRRAADMQRIAEHAALIHEQADKLGSLLEEGTAALPRVSTKAEMMSTHWFGVELAGKLEMTRNQAEHLDAEVLQARQELAYSEYRSAHLADKAKEARVQASEEAEARRDADMARRR